MRASGFRRAGILLALATLWNCADNKAGEPAGNEPDTAPAPDTDNDAAQPDGDIDTHEEDSATDGSGTAVDGAGADGGDDAEALPLAPYVRSYPMAGEWPAPDGMRWARAIVHLHSAHSHDACDGDPRPDGGYNGRCIEDLREAMCLTRLDVAWLTDHPVHVAETPFLDSLLLDESRGDVLVRDEEDRPMANSLNCGDGFRVLVRSGSEDRLMPLGFRGHPVEDTRELDLLLNERTPEAAATMRSTGALIWQAHTEERSMDDLRAIDLDGLEIYQLHANLDPDIRRDSLGLDPTAPLVDLVPFVTGETDTPPDLAALMFLEPNQPSLNRWAALLQERPVVGTAGTDAHQNVLRAAASDGERFDSYRRMSSWFSNDLLVDGELTAETAENALASGRVVIGFDVLGHPAGFDAAVVVGDARFEMGSTFAYTADALVRVHAPSPLAPGGVEGVVRVVLLRADGEAWVAVETREGPGDHSFALARPGVYRVEVRTTARHLAPYLAGFEHVHDREYAWLVTNAWRAE